MHADERPQSEVHATYIKLTWQNAAALIVLVGLFVGLYWRLSARDDAISTRVDGHDEALKKMIQVQQYQSDWLTGIAVKTGTPPPPRTP